MSSFTLDEMMPLLSREATSRKASLLAIFVVVSLALLLIGFLWQKQYLSHTTLYVDDTNVVRPLLEDIAESADQIDKANVAREIIFSRDILDTIMAEGGWVPEGTSAVQRERIKEEIIENTIVENINSTLIGIGFYHKTPKVAYETTRRYADLFLEKSVKAQSAETNDAFDFIEGQVETYRGKLEDAERRLESFKAAHPGARPGTESNVDSRIIELRRELEGTQLLFSEANQRAITLDRELASESLNLQREYRDNRNAQRIQELQSQIDVLRLSYTDDYPDIIRLKQQIEEFRSFAAQGGGAQLGSTGLGGSYGLGGGGAGAGISPVYQELRAQAAQSKATAESLRSRLAQTRSLLQSELGRADQSTKVERELAELSRDYEINKQIYEDLVKRRENARVSMVLGKEKQGVLYRIQEPANFPVLPSGLRFMHWAALGLILGAIMPFLYLFTFIKLDPRIRTASGVTDDLDLPLLTVVPHMSLPGEQRGWVNGKLAIFAVVVGVLLIYAITGFIKYSQGVV